MPRRGLSRAAVVETAARLADREGYEALTLGAVAAEAGVRPPSLYNHVDGLAGLRRELALAGLGELGERLRDAAVGRAGDDALHELAAAYRAYAREHPGVYGALQRAPEPDDDVAAAAGARLLEPVFAVLRGFGLEGDAAVHAARALRSAMHGFAELERVGGFGIDLDVDESYRFLIGSVAAGIRA
ncbi:MAG TPA: TetR/AcrR family transcriptional regulator [Gaiellales bacterium]|nr:TetR/AcrR family transcriptional regulator [Gaiellales bacterium]